MLIYEILILTSIHNAGHEVKIPQKSRGHIWITYEVIKKSHSKPGAPTENQGPLSTVIDIQMCHGQE